MKIISKKYEVGEDAIALRYCLETFPKAIVLSGANSNIHLEANLKTNQFSLTHAEMEQLNAFGISRESYWNERKQLAWN
jgi:diketogulonate reductase-like aldo/keto reductase